MRIGVEYLKAIQNVTGFTHEKDVVAAETRERIKYDMLSSINLEPHCTRNGQPQQFVVTTTDSVDVMDILAFPEEELVIGDLIYCYDHYWLVKELYATNFLQKRGKMIQCNLLLRFQNHPSAEIFERHVALDSGVYSTTEKEQRELTIPDQQFKMYAQIDDAVRGLYVGKRIAIGTWTDDDGSERLLCFRITAVDPVSLNFGIGNLVEFKLRSALDEPQKDSVAELICDYISVDNPESDKIVGGW